MKKLTVAVVIVSVFVLYSFVNRQPGGAALSPSTSVDSGSVASSVTATSTGASNTPPTPTAPSVATVNSSPTPTPDSAQPTETTGPTPSPTTAPTPTIVPTPTSPPSGNFKDGTYIGNVADAQWGYVQIKAVIAQGRISDVQFVQYPNDRSRSIRINAIADPMLRTEALQAQSAQVDIISGATDSSEAFIQSLSDALSKAKA